MCEPQWVTILTNWKEPETFCIISLLLLQKWLYGMVWVLCEPQWVTILSSWKVSHHLSAVLINMIVRHGLGPKDCVNLTQSRHCQIERILKSFASFLCCSESWVQYGADHNGRNSGTKYLHWWFNYIVWVQVFRAISVCFL